ncbi:hypothetical protein Pyrde_0698 [Pyrodictium delaneyi]|uniref:Uncharacterized protein n=1 Tax=Pyrodictium delaneyi TaxID=1273541 RepID=A0A0P0N2I1_9CREN|nr:hypothetical protein [Pyrodictium delaneyi]ALL00748.1 hypothetical protein Pyrde_0698 [Pyrodictium delaneyi]
MAKVILRPGLYREVIAGMVWMLLRLEGCMGPREVAERLRQLGLDASRGKINDALVEYTGRLFRRMKMDGHVVYCAEERV